MAGHVGIVACSAEGAALCYRTICAEAAPVMGEHNHPQITMHTHPLADYLVGIRAGDWSAVAELMLDSTRIVAAAGAELAVCPDNTIHQAFELVEPRSPIRWLHIAREVARAAKDRGYRTVGVLGTKYLMTGPVYPDALAAEGIERIIPDGPQRERIDEIIFGQLVYGVMTNESRGWFCEVIEQMKSRRAEAVVLGCTEIPLLIDEAVSPLPTLDSTRLLARAAIREATRAGGS